MPNRPHDAGFEPRPGEQAGTEAARYEAFLGALERAGLGPRDRIERIAAGVLCTLERRMTGGAARSLNLELPWALQDLLRSCPRDERGLPERTGAREFVATLADDLGLDPAEAERAARLVLSTARGLLSEKESADVLAQLPPDLQALWARPT